MIAIMPPLAAALKRVVQVKDSEIGALVWSFAYFFFLLSSYYVLRPLRDEMGIQGGVRNLPWLFTGTFAAMLLAVPLFGALVARFPRRRIVPVAYRFFVVNILLFYGLFVFLDDTAWVARAFFIWVSVFNLFAVSVFWSLMADLHDSGQGKRLFGFIAAGGSVGALVGPGLTAALAVPIGTHNLLLASALLLEAALFCVRRLLAGTGGAAAANAADAAANGRAAIGGGILAGVAETARSPYLIGICLYIFFHTATSTFLYFLQAGIVSQAIADAALRTRLFALIDLVVGVLTLLIQVGVTGRLTVRFGVGVALALLPAVTLAGFALLAAWPAVGLLVAVQGIRRAANFAVSRPAREVLFTVLGREWKYKAKNFIDTVVYRGGDALTGWAFAGLTGLGLGLAAIAGVGLPLAVLWLGLSVALGRRQKRLAGDSGPGPMYADR